MRRSMIIFFFILILFLESAYGLSIGVSPEEIRFSKSNLERQIVLFNPNDVDIDYNLAFEKSNGLFMLEKNGTIRSNGMKKLIIRYNSTYIKDLDTKLDVKYSFKGNETSIGLLPTASIKVVVDGDNSLLLLKDKTGTSLEDAKSKIFSKENAKDISTMIAIILVIAIFIYLMIK